MKIDSWELLKVMFEALFAVFSNPKIWVPFVIAIIFISLLKFGLKKLDKKINAWKYSKKHPASNNNPSITNRSSNSCPKCSVGYMTERSGKFGKFWGCSNYPRCRYTEQIK